MTIHYHVPFSGIDDLSAITFNSRLSDLDAAIYALSDTGGAVTEITVTLGESVAAGQPGYVGVDGQGYLLDGDAQPAKVGMIRGFWTATAASGATSTLQINGLLSGFTGLTPLQPIYADSVSGGITQVRPSPVKGGSVAVIIPMGFALSATEIFINPEPVQYQKRAAMSQNDIITMQHHPDERGYRRAVSAYLTQTVAGAEIAGYSSSNQDSLIALKYESVVLHDTNANQTGGYALGNAGGVNYMYGQTLTSTVTGKLKQIQVENAGAVGSPTGTITWQWCVDGGNAPGAVLESGTYTPVLNSWDVITPSGNTNVSAGTKYWLVLKSTNAQANNNFWWTKQEQNKYNAGQAYTSTNGGTSWALQGDGTHDFSIRFSVDQNNYHEQLAQTFTLNSATDVAAIGLHLWKVGAPTGTAMLRIETVSGGSPTGTLADVNATTTFAESSLGTSLAEKLLTFASEFALAAGTYAIVLSTDRTASATDYVEWGADGSAPSYAGGEMQAYDGSAWASRSADAIFGLYAPGTLHPASVNVDWWASSHADVVNRYGDGNGVDKSTKTTFKCLRVAGFDDVTMVVEIR